MGHSIYDPGQDRPAWNAGHKLGAKRPLKPKQVWAIRLWLEREAEDGETCPVRAPRPGPPQHPGLARTTRRRIGFRVSEPNRS